jgi:hypothetical protein
MLRKVEFPELWSTLEDIEEAIPLLCTKEKLEAAIVRLSAVYNMFIQHVDVHTNMGAFLYSQDWHSAVKSDLVRKYKACIEKDEE